MTAFEEFGVLPALGRAVDDIGWQLPRDVQAEAIPMILGGGDVLMAAETGSGKTGAFCLPVLQIVWESCKDEQTSGGGSTKNLTKSGSGKQATLLNVFDRDEQLSIDVAQSLCCQSRDFKAWMGARATRAVCNRGKYYYEAVVQDEGLCRVGWSTAQAKYELGVDDYSYGFGGTGKKSHRRQFDDYGESYGNGDTIGCLLDLDAGSIGYTKNGRDLGVAFRISPSRLTLYPAVVLKNAEMRFNFGATGFRFGPPAGFVGVDQAPSDCVASGKTTASTSTSTTRRANNAPMAIIIEPSRELAEQTSSELDKFSKYLSDPKIASALLIGGRSANEQLAVLQRGVDIVSGTPGRLDDMISSGDLLLSSVRFLVLDEADGLLQGGHDQLIERIWRQVPKVTPDGRRLQMIVCSATLHNHEVKRMADRLMHFPTWIDLKGQDSVPETVHHVVCRVDPQRDRSWMSGGGRDNRIQTDGVHAQDCIDASQSDESLSEAVKLLKGQYVVAAIRAHKMEQCLVFCRTKLDCDNLERFLERNGGGPRAAASHQLSCVCLHGDRKPQERQENLERFKRQAVRLLLCTDVAARGIDIKGVPYVLQVTLPDEKTNYVHRIGRVGRAERMGLAISLVSTVPEKVWYHGQWCRSRGRNCHNTDLIERKGCCTWYDEPALLGQIEDHLGVTIQSVDAPLFSVPKDEFDGVVAYGAKRKEQERNRYRDHAKLLSTPVAELAALERRVQVSWLSMRHDAGAMKRLAMESGGGGEGDASEMSAGGEQKRRNRRGKR